MARLTADPLVAVRKIFAPDVVLPDDCGLSFPKWSGAYVLLILLRDTLGEGFCRPADQLAPGWYAYAGSARGPGGVGARIARHMRRDKKPHWHVDRLTLPAERIVAFALRDASECAIAARLRQSGLFAHVLPGFGSSDCRDCDSHLLQWRAGPRVQ